MHALPFVHVREQAPPLLLHGSVPSHLPFLPRGQGALSPLRGAASPLVDSAVHPA